MKKKVVIIGHSYSSRLSIIRSVAQIGCEITVIVMTVYKRDGKTLYTKKPIDCYSKYVSHVHYCRRTDKEGLIRILLERCADLQQKVILIPDSDDTVAAIDNNREKLKEHFLFPYIIHQPDSMEYWMDKTHQKEAARDVGLNVANAQIVEISDGHYKIPDTLRYPCFTKPLATMNGGKGGMRRCDNASEVASALDFFIANRNRGGKILIEDFKEIHHEYALLGFSDGKEVIIPGIMQLLVISKKNKGIALQGKVMPVDGFEEVIDKFKQLVLRIGFVGVFDIDFYESDGKIYFCEMNLRFGGSGYAVTKMGVNLPAMFVRMCQGQEWKQPIMDIQNCAIYVNERMLFDDWAGGCISYNEYLKYYKTADILFISDADDNQPEKAFKREVWRRQIIKFINKLIKLKR